MALEVKKILILGASPDPGKYSNIAARKLIRSGYEVVLLGIRHGEIEGQKIQTVMQGCEEVHTVALYLSREKQDSYSEFIFSLKPQRIIFNPGTENPELMEKARQKGIETVYDCLIEMIQQKQF